MMKWDLGMRFIFFFWHLCIPDCWMVSWSLTAGVAVWSLLTASDTAAGQYGTEDVWGAGLSGRGGGWEAHLACRWADPHYFLVTAITPACLPCTSLPPLFLSPFLCRPSSQVRGPKHSEVKPRTLYLDTRPPLSQGSTYTPVLQYYSWWVRPHHAVSHLVSYFSICTV